MRVRAGSLRLRERFMPSTYRTLASWLVFCAVLVGAWTVVGPQQLNGPVAYVTVDGTSMLPTYNNGDLILAKPKDSYAVGDVVTYVTDVGDQPFPVIHRIVEVKTDGSGYITQGDNRDGPDAFTVNDENIVGASWARVPHAGAIAAFFKTPTGIGALVSMMVFVSMLGDGKKRRTNRRAAETASAGH